MEPRGLRGISSQEVTLELRLEAEKGANHVQFKGGDVWELGGLTGQAVQTPPVVGSALPQVVGTLGQPCMGIFFFFNCLLQLDCQIYVGRGFPCFSILFTAVC